jgi:tetratricopeptide (TPR) repeat protein
MDEPRLQIRRSTPQTRGRLLDAIMTYLPGAWFTPSVHELVSLYRLRYKMALEEQKFDTALIFLNKIVEVDPLNLEAKFCMGELYHHYIRDYARAVEQYNKVIRLTANRRSPLHDRARRSLNDLMALLS